MVRDLEPGDPVVIGPYRLRGQLGAGGMGRVFLGLSAGGLPVAVKVIRADLATDPEFRARFGREVEVARKVSHRFTAPVIDADLDGPVPWLATAYVAGPSLAEAVAEHGPLPARTVLKLAAGLAEGLSAIHAASVVHRDLKPSNVLLASDRPRVIDFGISLGGEGGALTRTGLVMGSPGFMSPEQAEGREVGPASDIFSLGAVLTFAATGEGPFGSGSNMTLVHRLVSGQACLDRVPAGVRPLAERCLAADPRQRPTASDLLAETGVAEPTAGWLPDRMTRAFSRYQAPATPATVVREADPAPGYVPTAVSRIPESISYAPTTISHAPTRAFSPQTMASAKMDPRPSQPQARTIRRRPGRLGRRLAVALVVTGLSGALGAGGIALAASAHQSPGAHSGMGMPVQTTSPTTPAPHASMPATVDPTMSAPPSMTQAPAPAPTPSMSAPVSPTAPPSATASATPTAAPSATATPAATGTPSAAATPTATDSATPTPAAS